MMREDIIRRLQLLTKAFQDGYPTDFAHVILDGVTEPEIIHIKCRLASVFHTDYKTRFAEFKDILGD